MIRWRAQGSEGHRARSAPRVGASASTLRAPGEASASSPRRAPVAPRHCMRRASVQRPRCDRVRCALSSRYGTGADGHGARRACGGCMWRRAVMALLACRARAARLRSTLRSELSVLGADCAAREPLARCCGLGPLSAQRQHVAAAAAAGVSWRRDWVGRQLTGSLMPGVNSESAQGSGRSARPAMAITCGSHVPWRCLVRRK